MAEEFNKRKGSALEELKRLQNEDRRAGIHYEEPELKNFDAQSIFEIEESGNDRQKRHAFHLGKHSKKRSANVRIASQDLENKEIEIRDINFGDENEDLDEKPVLKRTRIQSDAKRESTSAEQNTVDEVVDSKKEIAIQTVEDENSLLAEEAVLQSEESRSVESAAEVSENEEESQSYSDEDETKTEASDEHPDLEEKEITDKTDPSETTDIELGADDLEDADEQEIQNVDEEDIQVEFYEEEAQDEEIGSDESEVPEVHEEEPPKEEIQENEAFDDDLDEIEIDEENLYEEKKRFLFSQYVKEQKYLEKKSQQGYHYVKREGNNFFFTKGDPRDFYYILNYYKEEPDVLVKHEWRKDGWKLITRNPSKNAKDAGWFVLRNEEQRGEYRKTIENEEEKYDFFRKYVNSCRSTLFLVFICMACCLVTGALQISYQGYLIGIVVCAVLFFIALVAFISYLRMLRGATRMSRLLRARLRLRAREKSMEDDKDESDEELDTEWNLIDK